MLAANGRATRLALVPVGQYQWTRRDLVLGAHLRQGAVLGAADASLGAGLLMHLSEGYAHEGLCVADADAAIMFALAELRCLGTHYASLTFKAIASDSRHLSVMKDALRARGHRLIHAPVARPGLQVRWAVHTARLRYATL